MRARWYHFQACMTIALGSFLLFQVQPIVARQIQPWFGSASSVWTACMMFFQFLLLAGYLYAHFINRYRVSRQWFLHAGLMVLALALLGRHALRWSSPIRPDVALFEAMPWHPVAVIVALLLFTVGLPFLILAANSTMVQAWFSKVVPEENAYSLYAVSNVGSLASLLSYPFLVENNLRLSTQGRVWSALFVAYAVSMLVLGGWSWRALRNNDTPPDADEAPPQIPVEPPPTTRSPPGNGLHARRVFSWLALSFLGSTYLLAVTNELTQDISPTPFLWLMPLSLYLLTFILAFSNWFDCYRNWVFPGLLAGCGAALYVLFHYTGMSIAHAVGLLCFSLFTVCLFCHNLIYVSRPPVCHLPLFYVMISLGGFLGGFFVSLIAPLIFPAFWEVHLSILLLVVTATVFCFQKNHPPPIRGFRYPMLVLAVVFAVLLGRSIQKNMEHAIYLTRNFYGAMRVQRETRGHGEQAIHRYQLMHGQIVHGTQFSRTRYRYKPVAYFHEETGLGKAILNHPEREVENRPFVIGVVGQGIGTIAAYARELDHVRFYEINPQVHMLAEQSPWFTYLRDCKGSYDVVIADGRLSLERELDDPEAPVFDVLVIDTFNGDAIPEHIVTQEAIEIYLQRLDPENGMLAFHATNRHLDFLPLGKAMAEHFGLHWRAVQTPGDGRITLPCLWLIFSRNPGVFENEAFAGTVNTARIQPARIWTDDFSSLFDLLKRRP